MDPQIFISYSHIDNETIDRDQTGWVSYFFRALEHELKTRIGQTFHMWRDNRDISQNDFFDDKISDAVKQSEIFVSVVSPVYLTRDYCLKELDLFTLARRGDDPQIAARKIMKVLKQPLPFENPDEHLPTPLRGREGFRFYEYDREKNEEIPFYSGFGKVVREQYWDVVSKVARDIIDQINAEAAALRQASETPQGPVVFLAETTSDLADEYRTIRGELEERLDARIVPSSENLPNSQSEAQAVIASALDEADISIHLLGNTPGFIPDGPNAMPIVAMQLELARSRAHEDPGFKRFIWARPGIKPENDRQQEILDGLKSGVLLAETDELVLEELEHFKSAVVAQLQGKGATGKTGANANPTVLLICNRADEDAAFEIHDYLYEQDCEVILPDFSGPDGEPDLEDGLAQSDAVLFYYGSLGDTWIKARLIELQDWQALGRHKPFKPVAVLLAQPDSGRKRRFQSLHADLVLSALDVSPGEALAEFVDQLHPER